MRRETAACSVLLLLIKGTVTSVSVPLTVRVMVEPVLTFMELAAGSCARISPTILLSSYLLVTSKTKLLGLSSLTATRVFPTKSGTITSCVWLELNAWIMASTKNIAHTATAEISTPLTT